MVLSGWTPVRTTTLAVMLVVAWIALGIGAAAMLAAIILANLADRD